MFIMHRRGIIDITVDTNVLKTILKGQALDQPFYDKMSHALEAFVELRTLSINDDDMYDALSGIINIIDVSLRKHKE